jgi:chemotaxis protein MotB
MPTPKLPPVLALACLLAGPARAQEAPVTAPPPSFEELQATIARMQERIDRLGSAASERDGALRFLEQQIDQAAGQIAGSGQTNQALRGEAAGLSSQLLDLARDRDRLTSEAGERDGKLAELEARLAAVERAGSESAKAADERAARAEAEAEARRGQVTQLMAEMASLRQELDHAYAQLAAAETEVDAQQETIEGLDARLAAALQQQVQELEQYRSEFFGRLRAALGDRPDLRIVGDRFVFQSELLFDSGSATLGPDGEKQLRDLAASLKEVAAQIPPGIDWVLRVDGHTDRLPVRFGPFRSNWELSVTRAVSVVEFLTREGIEPQHLAAAGFGEHRPIDPADNDAAYRRNRRIEFKLTES